MTTKSFLLLWKTIFISWLPRITNQMQKAIFIRNAGKNLWCLHSQKTTDMPEEKACPLLRWTAKICFSCRISDFGILSARTRCPTPASWRRATVSALTNWYWHPHFLLSLPTLRKNIRTSPITGSTFPSPMMKQLSFTIWYVNQKKEILFIPVFGTMRTLVIKRK